MFEQVRIIFMKGGIMMYPLAVCSFLTLLMILERIFVLRKKRLVSANRYDDWREWFCQMRNDDLLPTDKSPAVLNQILYPLIKYLPLPRNRFEERTADLARKQKHRLERGLVILETIAGVAPLCGLLGTALGMVEVFSRLSSMGEAKMSALSSGISQALFTTVAGLFIGIPALVAYNLLSRHVDSVMITAEEHLNALIDEFHSSMILNDQ